MNFRSLLITGASSGVGAALAVESAKRGAKRLYLGARNQERLEAVAEQCRAYGTEVETRIVDVTDAEKVREWILGCGEGLELVIANAGIATGNETLENVRKVFATNVGGVLNTVLPAIELFRSNPIAEGQKPRQLALISSIAGYAPLCGCPAYSGTKALVKTWGLALRGQLQREGIGLSVVCPGFIRSGITAMNTCPMPFFMEAPKAAGIILDGIARNCPLVAFPWPMRLSVWLLSLLPARLAEFISTRLPGKL